MKNNLAILYGRVSTDFVRQGRSIEAQDPRLRNYCVAKSIEIALDEITDQPLIFYDGQSGTIPIWKRTGGAKVWKLINEGKVGHLILTSHCRLGRRAQHMISFAEHCEKIGVALHVVDEGGEIDFTSPTGRLVFQIMCAVAESEQRRIAGNIKKIMVDKRRLNELCGTVPYGKDAVGTGRFRTRGQGSDARQIEMKTLVDNPAEMSWLRHIVTMHLLNWGYTAIARDLNNRGVPTKTGKNPWTAGTIRNTLANSYTQKLIAECQAATQKAA